MNSRTPNPKGTYILYWMTAYRRPSWNFALDRAVEWCGELKLPLIVLETLWCDTPWASDRFHQFVIDGMNFHAHWFKKRGVLYYPYVEPKKNARKDLFEAMAKHAAVIVSDDFPCFYESKVSTKIGVKLEKVDSNGLLPLRATKNVFPTAYAFRRFLQKNLAVHLSDFPKEDALSDVRLPKSPKLAEEILSRWPKEMPSLSTLPIDHSVGPTSIHGGMEYAQRTLQEFLLKKLARYVEDRNSPEDEGSSGLSPYLHFGNISTHEIFCRLAQLEGWNVARRGKSATGKREGWWGMSVNAEAFLDELVIWRELGFNMCSLRDDYDQYESLPPWAQTTLSDHAGDRRAHVYSLEEFEQARTHDPLWNAAQTQLVRDGKIHNYLRMLWGKKILEWTASPREALEIMIDLNNKYALDGRDPNSYSGIFWVLGRYDRAWGPERPIFGKVRYMSSENTARKLRVKKYIERYAVRTIRPASSRLTDTGRTALQRRNREPA